jgi:hypothetical protein
MGQRRLWGHSRPNWAAPAMSGLPPLATEPRTSLVVRSVPNPKFPEGRLFTDTVEKVLSCYERNFSAPRVRPTRGDVRDHIDLHKSNHGSSYLPYRGLQQQRKLETVLREIFGAARFSTFSTASTRNGHGV